MLLVQIVLPMFRTVRLTAHRDPGTVFCLGRGEQDSMVEVRRGMFMGVEVVPQSPGNSSSLSL